MYGLEVTLGWGDIGVAAVTGAGVSLLLCLVLVATRRWHGRFTNDGIGGVQKFHAVPTPRIGGLALALSYAIVWPVLPEGLRAPWALIGLAGSLPLLAGLGEDLTGRVGVRYRLLATMGGGRRLRDPHRLHHAQGQPARGGLAAVVLPLRAALHRLRHGRASPTPSTSSTASTASPPGR